MRAFSLVELSIVLVILGLLTGGVLSGQSLIRAAELRALSSELLRYRTAAYTFRDKYMAWPGDMRNATQFWTVLAGDGTGNDSACQNAAATGTATCNGNGDGYIEANTVLHGERWRGWQHLANAGLVEGRYTGKNYGTELWGWQAGTNCPTGRLQATAYVFSAIHWTIHSGDYFFIGTEMGNYISLLNRSTDVNSPFLKPEEMWNIDTKLDDGKPGTGAIISYKATTDVDCTTSDDRYTAAYKLTYPSKACAALYFKL